MASDHTTRLGEPEELAPQFIGCAKGALATYRCSDHHGRSVQFARMRICSSGMSILSHKNRRRIARALLGLMAYTWLAAAAAPCFMDMPVPRQSVAGTDCGKAPGDVACPATHAQDCGPTAINCNASAQAVSADTHPTGTTLALPVFAISISRTLIQFHPVPARRFLAVRPPQRPLHLQLVRLLT